MRYSLYVSVGEDRYTHTVEIDIDDAWLQCMIVYVVRSFLFSSCRFALLLYLILATAQPTRAFPRL
jgi:hypothetical protein